jgi:death-on-curing family protein
MDDLTFDQILAIHHSVMEKSGGDSRLLSEPGLHQLAFRVNCTSDLFLKAAIATFLVAAYPPFRDGNKRTSRGLVDFILSQGGYILSDNGEGFLTLMEGVASFTIEEEDIEHWLRSHARQRETG